MDEWIDGSVCKCFGGEWWMSGSMGQFINGLGECGG